MKYRGKCKLCHTEKNLIKAHIIPRSLLSKLLNNESPKIYPEDIKDYPKKCPTGIYDQKILCKECDGKLGIWDNYAQEFLQVPIGEYGPPVDLRQRGLYEVRVFDYSKLKLFFLSVLWRAHITQYFFKEVKLDSWEVPLYNMVKNSDPGNEDDFSVILSRYYVSKEEYDGLQFLLPTPTLSKGANLNYYKFRIADYVVLIKVDSLPFLQEIRGFILRPNSNLFVGLRDYIDSEEFSYAVKTKGTWSQ